MSAVVVLGGTYVDPWTEGDEPPDSGPCAGIYLGFAREPWATHHRRSSNR